MTVDRTLYPDLPSWVESFRATQTQAIEEILDTFRRGKRVAIVEAPTGAGKSLIAEAVRERLDVPGLYVCTTKTLQDQFQRDFSCAVLKGKANYIPTDGAAGVTCDDCTFKGKGNDGFCLWCIDVEECPYRVARRDLSRHRLGVVNTAYLLAQIGTPVPDQRITRHRGLLIIDEADELEGTLVSRAEVTVSVATMDLLGVEPPTKGAHGPTVGTWLRMVSDRCKEWANEQRPPRSVEMERQVKRVRGLGVRLARVAREMTFRPDEWVRGYQDGTRGDDRVILKPVVVGGWGRELLWDQLDPECKILAMSATIVSGDQWAEDVGLTGVRDAVDVEWEMLTVRMGFPVENRPIHVWRVVDMARGDGWEERWDEMGKAVAGTLALDNYVKSNTLVHTVSFALTEQIVRAIVANPRRAAFRQYGSRNRERELDRGQSGIARSSRIVQGEINMGTTADGRTVWAYSSGRDRQQAVDAFVAEGGVLVAASLERGADFRDDQCRLQIIAKIPFGNLGDRRTAARMRLPGGGRWYATDTARSLVQMTGRGVRSETDWCETVVLDAAFMKFYSEHDKLLPKWWRDAIEVLPEQVARKKVGLPCG